MTAAVISATVLTALFLVAALLVVWARKRTWVRGAAVPLALCAATGSALTVGSTLGFAVPLIAGITIPAGEHIIQDSALLRDNGIYVTIDLPGGPRLFWMPWDKEKAEELQDMLGDPNNAGAAIWVPPFDFSWDKHQTEFQPLPQPKALPDKPEPPQAPRFAA